MLKEPGGEFGNIGSYLFGTPLFSVGERVLIYLDTWADGSLRVRDMFLGKFSLLKDPNTGETVARRELNYVNVELFPADAIASGQAGGAWPSTSEMELNRYLRMVRARVAANEKKSCEFESQYYSGISLLAEPPEYRRRAAAGAMQPQFHIIVTPTTGRWFEVDSGNPVKFVVDTDLMPTPNTLSDVAVAMNTWSTVQGSSLRVVNAGSGSGCAESDGEALLDFSNCRGYFGSGPCYSAFLGIGGYLRVDLSSTVTINGTTFNRLLQSYAGVNAGAFCTPPDDCYLEQAMTHEMGHALGLAHSWDPTYGGTPSATDQDASMYWAYHTDGRCSILKSDDVNAVLFVYPGTGGSGGGGGGTGGGGTGGGGTGGGGTVTPVSIAGTTLPRGTQGAAYSATLTATGGTAPYTWSLLSTSGPIPPGLSLSASGAISGTPSVTNSYGFTVQVTDGAGKTAQSDLFIIVADPNATVGGYGAQFIGQSVPATVSPGQQFIASITWLNTGVAAWNGGTTGTSIELGSLDPVNNETWGLKRLAFGASQTIAPQTQAQMSFNLFAPSTPGFYDFQWQMVQDSGAGFFGDRSPDIIIVVGNPGLAITTPTLPTVQYGEPVSIQLNAFGGKPPYTWSLASGALPTGLVLDPTGSISGTVTGAGVFTFTLQVTDSSANSSSRTYSLNIAPPPLSVPQVTLPVGITGTGFTQQLSALGGVPPYLWSLASGQLPAGLSLDATSGLLSGTPTAKGSFDFSVAASDHLGTTATVALHLLVVSPNTVPHAQSAKYKSGPRKLKIIGQNFDPAAAVTIDGTPAAINNVSPSLIVIKPISLATGTHTVSVTNPNGLSSSTTVQVQ
ncbi:MAG TPA: putative Ig domain-containing protein [Blastocatellia bacterium]|nr:putative Ig domain-containing protein [Blastocatellia bacterium]